MPLQPPRSTLFPYTTLFRSHRRQRAQRRRQPPREPPSDGRTARQLIGASGRARLRAAGGARTSGRQRGGERSEEHTSELQSLRHLVCRLLLEKKKTRDKVME